MKKTNPDDQKFTNLITSHRFENDFIIKQSETESQEVKLSLFEKTLTFHSKEGILLVVVIDKNFKIIEDDLSTYSFRVSFELNNELYQWKICSKSLSVFTEWKQALLVSRRPTLIPSNNCKMCAAKFHFFRKKYYCKYCGQAYCSKCCMYRAIIPSLGYTSKQQICEACISALRIPGLIPHSSLVFKRKKLETRSILE